uniref:MAT1-2-1 n=2 Tax=Eutiarosporella tritici-australis TaxID=1686411 RepID=A0A2D1GT57_9PEZI|nr:MAT1-2-1 [Eutiarosporella tritici-australis]
MAFNFNFVTVTGPQAERIMRDNIELAWRCAQRQLQKGQCDISFPQMITSIVGRKGLVELTMRYNAHINNECSLVHDPINKVWRLYPPPAVMPAPATAIPTESALVPRATHAPVVLARPSMNRVRRVETKVKRPMNCFMLYRKEKHAETVLANPGTNNVGISTIIGNMWKHESPDVRMAYKAKAFKALQAHKDAHPDYSYKPRKSSEIKKRKKREALRNSSSVFAQPREIADAVMAEHGVTKMPHLDNNASKAHGQFIPFCTNPDLPWVNMSFPARVESQSLLDALNPGSFIDDACANVSEDDQLVNDLANQVENDTSALWAWGELSKQTPNVSNPVSMDNTENVLVAAAERHASLVDDGALETISEFHFDAYNHFAEDLSCEQVDGDFDFTY